MEVTTQAMLPILRDPAHSVSTIKHVMCKVKELTSFLNPGQVPVMAADQPLYTIAKNIQWSFPEEYGEDKFVIMFGGLHVEQAEFKSIGSLLQQSGWTHALTADSYLSTTSNARTRQAHQISAATLYKQLKDAHSDFILKMS